MSSGTDTDLTVPLAPPTIKILSPVGGTVTVRASGDLDARAAVALTAALDRAAGLSDAAVVADLMGVGYFTMEAAAELLLLVRHCDELKREVRVLASPTVRHKLTMLGLHRLIPLSPPR